MVECLRCKRGLSAAERRASISGSIMGDECIDSYYLCPDCLVYTVECYRDNFTGEESERLSGPVSKADGDARVELIGKCGRPWDKKCRCGPHVEYFRGTLD